MPLHKVFSNIPGAEFRIDFYGSATTDSPAMVPSTVAAELASDPRFRIVAPDPETTVTVSKFPSKAALVPEQAASPAEEK